jgi:polysaccharide pyruvyl transferase CsaB
MNSLRIGISPGDIAYNRGDEAIVLAMIIELQRRGHQVSVVFSRNPARTERRLGIASRSISPFSPFGSHALKDTDLLLWGCGQLINDRQSLALLPYFAFRAWQAMRRDIPVVLFAAGVGQLKRRFSKILTRYLVRHCRLCSVRDDRSRDILRECGISGAIFVTADPAFLLSRKAIAMTKTKAGVVFAVREWFLSDYNILPQSIRRHLGLERSTQRSKVLLALYAEAADQLIENGLDVSFVAMSTASGHNDLLTARQIVGRMRRTARIVEGDLTVPELLKIFSSARVVVATRMHAAILALAAGSRPVVLTYEAKGEALVERMGLQEWSLDIEVATPTLLVDKVKNLLVVDDAIDRCFQREISRMCSAASSTFDFVDGLTEQILGRP